MAANFSEPEIDIKINITMCLSAGDKSKANIFIGNCKASLLTYVRRLQKLCESNNYTIKTCQVKDDISINGG